MKHVLLSLFVTVTAIAASADAPLSLPTQSDKAEKTKEERTDAEFRKKLSQMLSRTENSIKILREQITESTNAPFLADLYLKLGELLTQRSTALYYIQMERQKDSGMPLNDKEFSPVVEAQKEAVAVYRTVLKDFPKFDKRRQTLYRLELTLKSIDENIEFLKVALELLKDYPDSEEAMGSRILVGQHFYDKQQYDEALKMLQPVAATKFPFERNLARYRIGLIYLGMDRFRDALTNFEQVIQDTSLKELDNPYDVSLRSKKNKTDLKREALIDSVRAYTYVFEKNPDPVNYYAKLAPTELYFQEVIEKLALRYIELKKYDAAIKLLRAVSERTPDPQKVVNIYRDVLLLVPLNHRIAFPVEEMAFLLHKYNLWISFYQIPPKTKSLAYNFLEKQVRELGTTSHDIGKKETDPRMQRAYYVRAANFYLLYLAYFKNSTYASKMSENLGDVYFALGEFIKSGEYYLRTFNGEFGKGSQRRLLVENAILCFQKKGSYSFYDTIRIKGLLIKSIKSYMAFNKKMENDIKLAFLLVKTEYEQGFFPESLEHLLSFMKKFKKGSQVVDAGELVLDYFNTKSDYAGIETWANRMLALKLPENAFNQKLTRVRKQAKAREVHEKIRQVAGYDDFAQGKSYLSVALNSEDAALKNLALQEALAKSKREKDFKTFLEAAGIMAEKEKTPEKKLEIWRSIAREHTRVAQYYQGTTMYVKIASNETVAEKSRVTSLEDALNTSLLLRDWPRAISLTHHPLWSKVSANLKNRFREQLSDAIDSPIQLPPEAIAIVLSQNVSDDTLLALFKSQRRLVPEARSTVLSEVRNRCAKGGKHSVCLWPQIFGLEAQRVAFLTKLKTASTTIEGIQSIAPEFQKLTNNYRNLENSDDVQLEIALALKNHETYKGFATYLTVAASKNAAMKTVLTQKANETLAAAKGYLNRCQLIVQKSPSVTPSGKYCASDSAPSLGQILEWKNPRTIASAHQDPQGEPFEGFQRAIFAGDKTGDAQMGIAREFYDKGLFQHAAAASSYGMSLFKERERDFRAVLGCSVMELGFYSEANYHLQNADSAEGLKERCQVKLDELKKGA